MNSASLCSLAGRYDIPIPPRFLVPIDFLKIPAQFFKYHQQAKQDAVRFPTPIAASLLLFTENLRKTPIREKIRESVTASLSSRVQLQVAL